MSYPYTNQSIEASVPDTTVGRVLFIDDATALTPKKFYSYVKEGFMPMGRTIANDTCKYEMVEFSTKLGDDVTYTLKIGSKTYTAAPTEVEGVAIPAWDLPYSA